MAIVEVVLNDMFRHSGHSPGDQAGQERAQHKREKGITIQSTATFYDWQATMLATGEKEMYDSNIVDAPGTYICLLSRSELVCGSRVCLLVQRTFRCKAGERQLPRASQQSSISCHTDGQCR